MDSSWSLIHGTQPRHSCINRAQMSPAGSKLVLIRTDMLLPRLQGAIYCDERAVGNFLHLSFRRNKLAEVSQSQYSECRCYPRRSSFIATRKKRLSDVGRLSGEKKGS